MTDPLAEVGPLRLPRRYCPIAPWPKQEWFLRCHAPEAFFGGAGGGGKTFALLAAALQYADVPGYHAMILRPTYGEFFVPGMIHETLCDWFTGSGASWSGSPIPQWRLPHRSSLTYGYLGGEAAVDRYKGGALLYLGFDELVGFGLREYLGMMRLLRRAVERGLPTARVRSASNPATSPATVPNQAWIKHRFIDPVTRPGGIVFVPSRLEDNPGLDAAEYLLRLAHLLPADRERLVHGDWDVVEEGALFRREWFPFVRAAEVGRPVAAVRSWDLAATEPGPQNADPDWTTGIRLERDARGTFTVRHIVRGRWAAHEVEGIVRQTAEADGRGVPVRIEQEPGASGKILVGYFKRHALAGFAVSGVASSGDKLTRAVPVAAAAGNGLVQIAEGCPHTLEFLDEVASFAPGCRHDDCVDALAGAHEHLTSRRIAARPSHSVPRGRIPGVEARVVPRRV